MTISFPIECPTHLTPSSVKWSIASAVAISVSPTTYQSTKYEYDGETWVVDVAFPPLKRDEAAPFFAFLAALRNQNGTFLFGDTLLSTPRGTATGLPAINGANQTRTKALVTNGWTASTLVLKAGDFFEIERRLYMVLADVTSDASGNATIDIFPRLRSHPDGTRLVTNGPKGTFRLTADQNVVVDANASQLFNISFQAAEAL